MWFSVVCFWCQSFGDVFTLCMFIMLIVRFELLSDHLLVNSCPLGWPFVLIVFCLFVIFCYFPFWFWERDLPFDCFSSCSLLSHYVCLLTWAEGSQGELIVQQSMQRPSVRPSVRACVHLFTLSIIISLRPEGQSQSNFIWSIIGVREKLHQVWGQVRLVSLATDSSHRVIMGKILLAL